jgi:hypothetical protein
MNLMNGEQREHPATRFASRSAERIPRCPAPFDGSDKSGGNAARSVAGPLLPCRT